MTLALHQVAKTFPDGTRALKPTALQVEAGEIVSLLGPSGCGKTTLLRIIGGLEKPDAGGTVSFDGEDVTGLPVEKRRIGMVFQSYALFPNMSVRRNIGYGLKMLGLGQADIAGRVEEVIDICRLQGFEDRAIAALSGGQQQRVALARAVAPRPRVLLLDEPLSALDAALRDKLRDELSSLLRRFAITAVFVTHDQTEALAIADRVAVMSDGVVEQIAPPEALYRSPASAFVAQFVGDAQRLSGQVSDGKMLLPGGSLPVPAGKAGHDAFVRAEKLRLVDDGPLSGTVQSVVFLGTHYRVGIAGICDGLIYANHAGAAPAIGATVGLDVEADGLLLLPAHGVAA